MSIVRVPHLANACTSSLGGKGAPMIEPLTEHGCIGCLCGILGLWMMGSGQERLPIDHDLSSIMGGLYCWIALCYPLLAITLGWFLRRAPWFVPTALLLSFVVSTTTHLGKVWPIDPEHPDEVLLRAVE